MATADTTPHRHRVLLADDEPTILISLRDALRDAGFAVTTAVDGAAALAALEARTFDVVVSDIRMPGLSGLDLLAEVRRRGQDTRVVLVTAFAEVEQAVAAVKMGAHDYITKPFPNEKVVRVVENLCALVDLRAEVQQLRASGCGDRRLVGRSPAWLRVVETIEAAARTDSTVLVVGESGTGKEVVVNAIHERSARRDGPFVKVHCAALPPTLIESELFGHERGAFTGATQRRAGRFEAAQCGTLLLDEVDEIPLDIQVKLLRVLQEHVIERVGSPRSVPVDVRIVATSKRPLRELVDEGRFREDLFYRLVVVELQLPPLRDRMDDVPALAQHFLARFRRSMGKPLPGFEDEALDALTRYGYPGNVRELEHAVESACVRVAGDGPVPVAALPPALRASANAGSAAAASREPAGAVIRPLRDVLRHSERSYLEAALRTFEGSRTELARHLGISRKHLWQKLKEHDIADTGPDA